MVIKEAFAEWAGSLDLNNLTPGESELLHMMNTIAQHENIKAWRERHANKPKTAIP